MKCDAEQNTYLSTAAQTTSHALTLVRVLDNTVLPPLVWTVFPSGLFGRAVGATDLDVVAAVMAWAKAFKKPVSTLDLPEVVDRRSAVGVEWRIEPGRIEVELTPEITVGGDLVKLMPGIEAADDRLDALEKALRSAP